jgi:hypothetical protein
VLLLKQGGDASRTFPGLSFDALFSIRCFLDFANLFSALIRMLKVSYIAYAKKLAARAYTFAVERCAPAPPPARQRMPPERSFVREAVVRT